MIKSLTWELVDYTYRVAISGLSVLGLSQGIRSEHVKHDAEDDKQAHHHEIVVA